VDIFLIDFYALHIRTIDTFKSSENLKTLDFNAMLKTSIPYIFIDIFFYINTVKTIKYISPFFLHFLKDYTKGSIITIYEVFIILKEQVS
jgi:hypothetical protein